MLAVINKARVQVRALPGGRLLVVLLLYGFILYLLPRSFTWSHVPSGKWLLFLGLIFLVLIWSVLFVTGVVKQALSIRRTPVAVLLIGIPVISLLLNKIEGYGPSFLFGFTLSAVLSSLLTYMLFRFLHATKMGCGLALILSFSSLLIYFPGTREYVLFNFTDYIPEEIMEFEAVQGENRIAYRIPRVYLENGRASGEDDIYLEFLLPEMTPAFRQSDFAPEDVFRLAINLKSESPAKRFFGESLSYKSVQEMGVYPEKSIYGLYYYPPSRRAPITHVSHLYVPENASSFVVECSGEEPPSENSSCRRLSVRDAQAPLYIYWFRGKDLARWREFEEKVVQRLESFRVIRSEME